MKSTALYTLQDKLDLFVKKYKQLQASEAQLQQKVASLAQKVETLEQRNTDLEEALMVNQLVQDSDQEGLKMYIDAIIEEIEIAIKKL